MALKPVLDKLIDLYGVPLIAYGLVNFYGMDAGTAQGKGTSGIRNDAYRIEKIAQIKRHGHSSPKKLIRIVNTVTTENVRFRGRK
jgi:hypothetical protein